MTQNFRPNPSKFSVPMGGCFIVHRLCTARCFGCSRVIVYLYVLVEDEYEGSLI